MHATVSVSSLSVSAGIRSLSLLPDKTRVISRDEFSEVLHWAWTLGLFLDLVRLQCGHSKMLPPRYDEGRRENVEETDGRGRG